MTQLRIANWWIQTPGFLVAEELRVGDVLEDDELLNIGLWEDGAVKQLCCLVSIQTQTQIFVQIIYVQKPILEPYRIVEFCLFHELLCSNVFLPEPFWIA